MPISEALLAAVAEAVFGYVLEQSGLAERPHGRGFLYPRGGGLRDGSPVHSLRLGER